MKNSAFTLTELLVVITIVATIACLALPIETRLAERDRAAHEASNLRQLGAATAAYVEDNGGRTFSHSTPGGWPSVLHAKYGVDWKTLKSPFDGRAEANAETRSGGAPVSYGINIHILAPSANDGDAFDGRTAQYMSPGQLIYMAPNVDVSQSLLVFIPGTGDSNVTLNAPANGPASSSENRGTHAGRSKITALYADYHVAAISFRDFATNSDGDATSRARWLPIHHP